MMMAYKSEPSPPKQKQRNMLHPRSFLAALLPMFPLCSHFVPDVPALFPMFPLCSRCSHFVPDVLTLFPMFPLCSPCSHFVPDVPTLFPMFPLCSPCSHFVPGVPDFRDSQYLFQMNFNLDPKSTKS